jgi:hypothetical protein
LTTTMRVSSRASTRHADSEKVVGRAGTAPPAACLQELWIAYHQRGCIRSAGLPVVGAPTYHRRIAVDVCP